MGETNFDIIGAEELNLSDSTPSYTVGANKDFDSLHKALDYVQNSVRASGQTGVQLLLDDGIHLIGEPGDFNQNRWNFYELSGLSVHIIGSSAATCTISMPATDDGDNYPEVIGTMGGILRLANINLDMGGQGYPYPENVIFVAAYNATIKFQNCTGNTMDSTILAYENSFAYVYGSVFTGQYSPVSIFSFSTCEVSPLGGSTSRFQGGDNGLLCYGGSRATIPSNLYSGTANTADSNITLNEVQYDGSFISDETAALSFKA